MAAANKSHTMAILELPDELFGLIVGKLSLPYGFQLRCVCKQWNTTLHDTRFLKNHFQVTRRAPLCGWPTEKGFVAYSPETNDWHMLPLSFILVEEPGPCVKIKTYTGRHAICTVLPRGEIYAGHRRNYEVFGGADGLVLLSGRLECRRTSDGLIPVRGKSHHRGTLYLANPMTRSYRKVTTVPSCRILGMVLDESSVSFKIFGIKYCFSHFNAKHDSSSEDDEDHFCQNTLYMYDSELDLWEIVGEWGRRSLDSVDLPMFHRGVLHCLITKYRTCRQNAAGDRVEVLRFDGGKSWHQLPAPIPRGLALSHLFEWQGNLMLLAVKGDLNNPRNPFNDWVLSVEVWHLDEENVVSMVKTTMPDDLLHRFRPSIRGLHLNYCCHSGGGYVYLTSYSHLNNKFVRHVICDLLTPSWWEVSDPPSNCKFLGGRRFFSFLLNPSFDSLY